MLTSKNFDDLERAVMTVIKLKDRRTRAKGIIYYSHSGSGYKELSCKICGEVVTTWSAQYPRPKASVKRAEEHRKACLYEWMKNCV